MGRPAELIGPLNNSRSDPGITSANAGAVFERMVNRDVSYTTRLYIDVVDLCSGRLRLLAVQLA
jgi:hypothetical protein